MMTRDTRTKSETTPLRRRPVAAGLAAAMPMPDGRPIPVNLNGGGDVNVQVIDNAGNDVNVQQRRGNNGSDIEIILDQKISELGGKSGKKTNRMLKNFSQSGVTRR